MQHVLSRLAECRSRRRLAAEDRGGLPLAFRLFDCGFVVGELHGTWSPKLAPGQGHWRSIERLAALKCLGVVSGPHVQRDGIRHRRLKRGADPARPLCRWASFFEADDGRGVANAHVEEGRDFPSGIQVRRDRSSLAVGDNRPGELLGPEILRYRYGEDAPLPSRQKMRWLALVGRARLKPVIISNRDVQLLLQIPIEIAKKHAEAAVRIFEPALIGG